MTVSDVATTTSKVTSPPILDETGKDIAAAIRALKNTDPTLSVLGKPADGLVTGNEIKRLEQLVNETQIDFENTSLLNFTNIYNCPLELGGFSGTSGLYSGPTAGWHTSCKRSDAYTRYKFPLGTIILTDEGFEIEMLKFDSYNIAATDSFISHLRTTKNYYIVDDANVFYKIDILPQGLNKNRGPYTDLSDTNLSLYFITSGKIYRYEWAKKDEDDYQIEELPIIKTLNTKIESLITIDAENEKLNITI